MKIVKLNQVKKGEYLMRLPKNLDPLDWYQFGAPEPVVIKDSMVWVKQEYIRDANKYSVTKFDDMNREILMKCDVLVWVGFTF